MNMDTKLNNQKRPEEKRIKTSVRKEEWVEVRANQKSPKSET